MAVGQMKVIISVDANKPVCDTTAATPPVSGYVSQGNLNLDAGCRYNLYEASHATNCLQGSWIMMTGSSNTLLELLARWLRIFFWLIDLVFNLVLLACHPVHLALSCFQMSMKTKLHQLGMPFARMFLTRRYQDEGFPTK